MRISTKSIYESGILQMNNLQSALSRTQNQLATNRRNLVPSDDPIASSRALEVTQSQSINTQFVINRQNASNFLSQEELALTSTHQLIADVRELSVHAGNGTLGDSERASLAVELEGRLTDLLAQANTRDGDGSYLFSGFKSDTQPYSPSATGATYMGDQGQRQLQVGASRFLATSDAGSAIFDGNLTGNGTFATRASALNVQRGGQGIISSGSVTDPSKLTGHKYKIDFSVTPTGPGTSATTYIVTDTTLGQTVPNPAAPQPFTSGAAIVFDGQQLEIKGAPADLDQFTVEPSTKESLFTTLKTMLAVLRSPGTGSSNQAALNNGLNAANDTLDAALDNVLSVRAEVGARKKELDYLDSSGTDLDLQYASALSNLQDLDEVEAASRFTRQKATLQAAQQSFSMISGLSLFNYIR